MNNFNDDLFKNTSNNKIYTNDLFCFKNKKKESIIVEGPEDIEFYKAFLQNVYDDFYIPNITCVVNGKKEVLKLSRINKSKSNKYIVDLDYDKLEKINECGAIATTGYSMENFYFYSNEVHDNLSSLINMVCEDYGLVNKASDFISYELNKMLNAFYNNKLYYYAYMKTLHELNRPFSKKVKDATSNYEEAVIEELSLYPEFEKNKIKQKVEENINILKDTKYLMIRGHDIFDMMYDYFSKCKYLDCKKITKKYIYSLSEYLYLPNEFLVQFK